MTRLMTPDMARQAVELISGIKPCLALRGAKKGLDHIDYAYRYEFRNRHIAFERRATEKGTTVYLCQTSITEETFPEAAFPPGTLQEAYPLGFRGKGDNPGLSTAVTALQTINPQKMASMRLAIGDIKVLHQVLQWYFDLSEKSTHNELFDDIPTASKEDVEDSHGADQSIDLLSQNAQRDIDGEDDLPVQETERQAVIAARLGQGEFRVRLDAYWGACAVTACTVRALLRASHIQPWRDSSNTDRLNPFNGLLLSAHLDAAFDSGLISFDDTGNLLLHPKNFSAEVAATVGIDISMRLKKVDPLHLPFLSIHRAMHGFAAK